MTTQERLEHILLANKITIKDKLFYESVQAKAGANKEMVDKVISDLEDRDKLKLTVVGPKAIAPGELPDMVIVRSDCSQDELETFEKATYRW